MLIANTLKCSVATQRVMNPFNLHIYTILRSKATSYYIQTQHVFVLNVQIYYCNLLKMLGRYLYTLIIGHKSCNMLSILNKLTL